MCVYVFKEVVGVSLGVRVLGKDEDGFPRGQERRVPALGGLLPPLGPDLIKRLLSPEV